MKRILVVGENEALLKSRTAVLNKTGAEVVQAHTLELPESVDAAPFDLLVLCHTLQPKAALAVTLEAQKRWPEIRVLQLVRFSFEKAALESHVDAIAASDDPQGLVEVSAELLNRASPMDSDSGDSRAAAEDTQDAV